MTPFLKWAGGKRWLVARDDFEIPAFEGKYIEPFLGGGAVFFHLQPAEALLADANRRLINTYAAIAESPAKVSRLLRAHQAAHSPEHYYRERGRERTTSVARAAQFLYLNRTCWNGLYRENLKGEFNVPIGTKTAIFDEAEDFDGISLALTTATLRCQDFEATVDQADDGDFLFVDPPYTTAHNMNGFVKYNQKIFSWSDQERLRAAVQRAKERGAVVYVTNAHHASIVALYAGADEITPLNRGSVISGLATGRGKTAELLIKV